MRRVLVAVCFAFALTACANHRVATQPDVPPLAPPPPPPRVVTPPEPPPDVETPDTATVPPQQQKQRPQRRSEGTVRPEPPKPQPPPKPETVAPPPAREESKPAPTLQTTPPATQQEMERQAKNLLAQAQRDLGLIQVKSLNNDGKSQYDAARGFVVQANQALSAKNFVLALSLADKAATIASVLLGR